MEHKVKLKFGYTDAKGVKHAEVTFGKRPTLADMLQLDSNPLSSGSTNNVQLTRRLMITKFGELTCPVSLTVLAALDTIDDNILERGANEFLRMSRTERPFEIVSTTEVNLGFGITIDDVIYDKVIFGNRLTVADNIEADRLNLGDGVARLVFQVSRQISKLENTETGLSLDGQPEPSLLSDMDAEDFNMLRMAAEFFRVAGGETGPESDQNDDGDKGKNGSDGTGDNAAAAEQV